jgi:hypothetical protein
LLLVTTRDEAVQDETEANRGAAPLASDFRGLAI